MSHQLFDLIYPSRKSLSEWLVEVKKDGLDREKGPDGFTKFLEDTVVCFERDVRCRLEPGTMETSHRDIVDVAIAKLVRRGKENVLSKGFQLSREKGNGSFGAINGIEMWFPNTIVNDLKRGMWPELTKSVGDELMIFLLCESSLFVKLDQGNYLQVTGFPITSYKKSSSAPYNSTQTAKRKRESGDIDEPKDRSKRLRTYDDGVQNEVGKFLFSIEPRAQQAGEADCPLHRSDHTIPWTWMLYGRPIYNQEKGNIMASLPFRHPMVDVDLDRLFSEVFPFEHNLLHPLLAAKLGIKKASLKTRSKRLSRLRVAKELLSQAIKRYGQCNIQGLLDYYCKIGNRPSSQSNGLDQTVLLELHTPIGNLLGFIRSVFKRIIPVALFGSEQNVRVFLNHLEKLLRVRRYERLTLERFVSSIKLGEIEWLHLQSNHRGPLDNMKARHLFHEFTLWVINGFLIPLIKSNFYATETSSHKNLIMFFRHKVWTRLNAPLYQTLTNSIYKEVSVATAQESSLGISSMRLLPKSIGVRPIVNLSRKCLNVGERAKKSSVNQILTPIFKVLGVEVEKDKSLIGFSVASKKDIHVSLKGYKQRLVESCGNEGLPMIYFCKVDIKACFDSMNQVRLIELVEEVMNEVEYTISNYSSMQFDKGKVRRRFLKTAQRDERYLQFSDFSADILAKEMFDSIIVDGVNQQFEDRDDLLQLFKAHISNHIIKAGKRYFKQIVGIPQGSVLSTLMCSLYYGKFEKEELASIISEHNSLLMRLVDDFLFLTTDLAKATEFASVIHTDQPQIGFKVNASKSLVNFDMCVGNTALKKVQNTVKNISCMGMNFFPWCGLLIEMKQLDCLIDYRRHLETDFKNSLTVEKSRTPGQNFLSKVMICLKNRVFAIHIDPHLNRTESIVINVYQSFILCAHRFVAYVQDAFSRETINYSYLTLIIKEAVNYQVSLLKSRYTSLSISFSSLFSRSDIMYIGFTAFLQILKSKEPKFTSIIQQLTYCQKEAGRNSSEETKGIVLYLSSLKGNILTVLSSD